jgi:hypothetical protein
MMPFDYPTAFSSLLKSSFNSPPSSSSLLIVFVLLVLVVVLVLDYPATAERKRMTKGDHLPLE